MDQVLLLSLLIFVVAVLYSSVGHGGASGYLAAMALVGITPEVMKPSALTLNVLVATIGTVQYYRAGCFSWRVFLPFALGAAPFAFLGGAWALPGVLYKQLVGLVLLFTAYRLFRSRQPAPDDAPQTKSVSLPIALACGAGIGLLAGLTGTGGGIFLSPLLLLTKWGDTRQTAGVTAAFILVNSLAGILGHLAHAHALPAAIPYWAAAAVVGGLVGSGLGSRRFGTATFRRLLGVVLVIAALRLLLV
jgi:uncharacterized protein